MDTQLKLFPELDFDIKPRVRSDGGSTSYYGIPDGAKDLQDLIEHKRMCFSSGNIFKAIYRLGEKEGNDTLYELNKIIFFAERMKALAEVKGGYNGPK